MAQRQFRSDDTSTWTDKYSDGSAGVFTPSTGVDTTPNTTLTGTGGATAATVGSGTGFANGDLVLIHQTQGTGVLQWELNKISSGGGTTSLTMSYNLIYTYAAGAQVYKLFKYSSVNIPNGVTVTAQPWVAGSKVGGILAYLASQTITVNGTINLVGTGFGGGPYGNQGTGGTQGDGTVGAGAVGTNTANGNGGGAGGSVGSGSIGAAGGGANGTAGQTPGNQGGAQVGTGGNAVGSTDLVSASLGGGGGGGYSNFFINQGAPNGGNGSGWLILIAPTITFGNTAQVLGNGAAGSAGADGASRHVGGGGGAGASILLKGQTVNVGNNLISAVGGLGGNQGDPSPGQIGGNGGNGTVHIDYFTSVAGVTSPAYTSRQDSALQLAKILTLSDTITMLSVFKKTQTKVFKETIHLSSSINSLKNLVTWIKQPRPPVKP